MNDSSIKIKVCGMRDPENIKQLVKLQPDYIGFILYPPSKRYVGDDYKIEAIIPGSIKRVGVFVNALFNEVVDWQNRLGLNYVQLHGDESPQYCKELTELDIKIIKAFGVDDKFDFALLDEYISVCDFFLFDTKTPLRGGSGKKFDWGVLSDYKLDKPFFLSGGIGPDDAAGIKDLGGLPVEVIDINSRFEIEPGIKNIDLLVNFIRYIRENNK